MQENSSPIFILIDDDPINNKCCRVMVKSLLPAIEVQTFEAAEIAYEYLRQMEPTDDLVIYILLDVNMPSWTGWDFLENFESIPYPVRSKVKIYMSSASIDSRIINRAKNHPHVTDYIVKPLTHLQILNMVEVHKTKDQLLRGR